MDDDWEAAANAPQLEGPAQALPKLRATATEFVPSFLVSATPPSAKEADTVQPEIAASSKPAEVPVSASEVATAAPAAVTEVEEPAVEELTSFSEEAVQRLVKKGLKVPDSRPHLNVVFIGHVDAGKSTTCGNILFLTGQVDARTIEKYEREAKEKGRDTWYYAFILDVNEEERAKGKTQEVGRATFELPNTRFTILDAPGHKGLVPEMVSGSAQADIGVLIISARKGEFETGFTRGGQTREHALLAKTLGVNQLIVAVNKMDDPTCDWDKERYEDIVTKVTPFLKSCGFMPSRDVTFVPIAGLSGQNLKDHVADPKGSCYHAKAAEWYGMDRPTLLKVLEDSPIPKREENAPLRIPLLDGFRDGGVVAVGKIESGAVMVDQSAILMPGRIKVRVGGVKSGEEELAFARPGENVELRLLNVEEDQIHKGGVLCSVWNVCPCATKFVVQAVVVELLEHKRLITAGYSCVLHIHTACEEVEFDQLLSSIEQATKKKKLNPSFVKEGFIVTCVLKTAQPVCLEAYATRPQLGRFTLRDEGKTIAIGKVMEIRE